MTIITSMEQTISSDLCTSCGLCCDGTFFPRVSIPKEKYHLFTTVTKEGQFPLRCEHLSQCNTCAIYKDRPYACQSYKCGVLLAVEAGSLSFNKAQEMIKEVKGGASPQVHEDFTKYGSAPILNPTTKEDEFLPGMPLKIN